MNNSIRSNLDKETVISEIRLTLSNDFTCEKIIVVVEGEDDTLFFKGKVRNHVEIVESYSGKHGVVDIVSTINDRRVIGVRDKDCDAICNNQRIFYYDYSCLEIMMIMNDLTWQSVCNEFYFGQLTINELRDKMFDNLKWLTVFRKLNSENDWEIRFSGISMNLMYDKNQSCFDEQLGYNQLLNVNRDKSEVLLNECGRTVSGQLDDIDDDCLPMFTQGHDFIDYFKCICDSNSKKGIDKKTIGCALRTAYRLEDFKNSRLFEKLHVYSSAIIS